METYSKLHPKSFGRAVARTTLILWSPLYIIVLIVLTVHQLLLKTAQTKTPVNGNLVLWCLYKLGLPATILLIFLLIFLAYATLNAVGRLFAKIYNASLKKINNG
jgi:hypothetical protein